MKRIVSYLAASAFAISLLTGCDQPGPEHRRADFSPDGRMIATITSDYTDDSTNSSISTRKADGAPDEEDTLVYTAPENMEIFDVFWTKGGMVVFESGEHWNCPVLDEDRPLSGKGAVPGFDVRIVALKGSFRPGQKARLTREMFKSSHMCWRNVEKTQKGWKIKDKERPRRNRLLEMTNISGARDADLIVYEPLDGKDGLMLLNAKNGKTTNILEGRTVSNPSISWNGKSLAFTEIVEEGKTPDGPPESKEEKNIRIALKILDLKTGAESEAVIIAAFDDHRPLWSKDGKYLFIPSQSTVAFTLECDRKRAEAAYDKMLKEQNEENPDDSDVKKGPPSDDELITSLFVFDQEEYKKCGTVRRYTPDSERSKSKFAYMHISTNVNSLHKYYPEIGIAVKIIEDVDYFSINPETEQILVGKRNGDNEKKLALHDYSGREIRNVNFEYIEKFDAVNKFGVAVGSISDSDNGVPTLVSTATDSERPVLAGEEDLLALACHHFDKGNFKKAGNIFDEYTSKYGLPKQSGHRLMMIATYRNTGDLEKMMRITRTVPVKEIQQYFAVSGDI